MEIGKVIDCKHCNGTAKCDCYRCKGLAKEYAKNYYDKYLNAFKDTELAICSICHGEGSVWVGPETIKVLMHRGK
jgi:hypothetical protein